jgi:hypothetical protein
MMGFKQTRYLALGLGLGLSLTAQAPAWELGGKLGLGMVPTSSVKDQHSNMSMHLGLTGQYKLSADSAIIGELTYRYFRAEDWQKPLPATAVDSTGATFVPDSRYCIDTRKDELDGMALMAGYRKAIGTTGWSWQVGGNLHWLKSQDQAIGEFRNGSSPLPPTPREGFAYVRSTNSIKPGVFAGVHSFVNEGMFVEFNVVTVGYDQMRYVPLAYTGQAAHWEKSSQTKLLLELSAGFRF